MIAHIIHDRLRLDRWQHLQREVHAQKITPHYWDAVHHRNRSTAIGRAHKKIIQFAKDMGMEQVPILEDDVRFTAPGAWEFFLKNIPPEYDIYLGSVLFTTGQVGNVATRFAGTHCYMVHRRFYDKMLALPDGHNIDTALNGRGKFIVSDPMVATVYDSYSDRVQKVVKHDRYFKNKTFYMSNEKES